MTVENIILDVKTNAGDAARQVRSLSDALSGVRNAGKSVASGGTHKAVSRIGSAAKSSTRAMGKLFSSIKRIAFYRLLRTFIKELSQAFQEGLKNVYAFSKEMNTGLAQALDRIASASGQMKNQMGAAFGELLYTLEPIITAIVSLITSLMRALSALFAALGGRLTYTVADKTAKSWDEAAGSAKEYKNTILGFDEINRLNDQNKGGGGDVSIDGLAEVALPDWAKIISESIQRGDWGTAGKLLADHLNDVIDGWDADAAGRKLGGKIGDVIKFAFNFLKNLNTENIGERVANYINGAIEMIDAEMLGNSLLRAFTLVLDFFVGLLTNVDWGSVAKKIGELLRGAINGATEWLSSKDWGTVAKSLFDGASDMIAGLDYSALAKDFFSFLGNAFNAVSQFLGGIDWQNVGKNMFTNMDRILRSIDFTSLARNFFTALGTAFGASIAFLWGFIKRAWQQLVNWWHEHAYKDGKFTFQGLLDGIVWWIDGIVQWIDMNVTTPFIKAFCDLLGIHSPSTVFYEIGQNIVQGLINGFKATWDNLIANIQQWWENLKNWWNGLSLKTITGTVTTTTVNSGNFSHSIGRFAYGGFPDVGELFISREAGPELVGSIDGHTAVANNDQIVEAVASGVASAVSAVLGSSRGGDTSVHVYIDSREIKAGQTRLSRAMGV